MAYKINNQITAPELRVIDENNSNLGVLTREEALKLASEKNLDLIEITAKANPPVAKITSFDKFRYQKEKEERKRRQAQKSKELKRIRLSPRMAQNDLAIKAEQTAEFLNNGHKIEINMMLRGREKINKEWSLKRLNNFLNMIKIPYQIVSELKWGGRGPFVQIAKITPSKQPATNISINPFTPLDNLSNGASQH